LPATGVAEPVAEVAVEVPLTGGVEPPALVVVELETLLEVEVLLEVVVAPPPVPGMHWE